MKKDTLLTTDQQQKEVEIVSPLEDKMLVILGLGREGFSTYELLRYYFPDKKLWLIDEKGLGELGKKWQEVSEKDRLVEVSTHFDQKMIEEINSAGGKNHLHIFKTPGIPPQHQLVKQAQNLAVDHNLKITFDSNTDFFFRLLQVFDKKIATIGVTGTKGKSTTTSLIHHTLKNCGLHTFLGGNIGTPPLSLWEEIRATTIRNETAQPTIAVLELSSHQLLELKHSPNVAVILNIVPEHLDYYQIFDNYLNAKTSIAKYQNESDYLVMNQNHPTVAKIAKLSPGTKLTFDMDENIQDNWLIWQDERIVDLDTVTLVGKHNVENIMPTIIVAKLFNCPNEKIATSIQTFKPLPHRLELIAEVNSVSYYNDSLATNPDATIAAIKSFPDVPIILIAGGFDRYQDFSKLAQTIVDHQVKHLVLLPDTGEKIMHEVKQRLDRAGGVDGADNLGSADGTSVTGDKNNTMGELHFTQVSSMKDAVEKASEVSNKGDIVLLSPANASFNLFKDYADRGDQFRKAVGELVSESNLGTPNFS
jgi:UDP-N-acetylmuramoylalanine--D-glutamate ligase